LNYFTANLNRGERMHYIGKSKIGKHYSKPTITYPIIRLPLQCSEAIGTSVQIFKSEHSGQTVFLIIPDNEKSESVMQEVAQPTSKVAQLETEKSIESRLLALESKIHELEETIFQNNEPSNNKSPKNNGLGATRTPDLRRVKATS
jgi:hypothetical protein